MENNNLIKKIDCTTDARTKQIVLTEYSAELSKKIIKDKNKFETLIKDGLTKEELELFFKVTDKIKNNIMNMK